MVFSTRGSVNIKTCIFKQKEGYKYWPQYLATCAASLSLFSVGLHFSWPSPSMLILTSPESPVNLTSTEALWIVTLQPMGDLLGGPIASYLVDAIGRKNSILLTTIPHLTAWLMIAFASTPTSLMIARFIAGISEASSYICVPIYIGEIAQPEIRGILGSFISITMIAGILTINILGSFLTIRTTALVCTAFPVILLAIFAWMPESPYYYSIQKRENDMISSLKRLRRCENISSDLSEINNAVENQMADPGTFLKLFTVKNNFRALLIMLGARGFQQLSGASVFNFYTHTIFEASGIPISPKYAAIIYVSLQLVMTGVGTLLIDKAGRKPLMIVSSIGSCLFLATTGTYFYFKENTEYNIESFRLVPLVAMVGFIIMFSVGLGTVPNVMLGELFSANIKAKTLWLMNMFFALMIIIMAQVFNVINDLFGMYFLFWTYSTCCLISVFFVWFCVPETKGKTLNEIQNLLSNVNSKRKK